MLVTERLRGRPLGWATARGLLPRLHEDLSLVPASMGVDEPATVVEPSATAAEALEALGARGVTHLLVARTADGPAQGVVSELALIRLVAG